MSLPHQLTKLSLQFLVHQTRPVWSHTCKYRPQCPARERRRVGRWMHGRAERTGKKKMKDIIKLNIQKVYRPATVDASYSVFVEMYIALLKF